MHLSALDVWAFYIKINTNPNSIEYHKNTHYRRFPFEGASFFLFSVSMILVIVYYLRKYHTININYVKY